MGVIRDKAAPTAIDFYSGVGGWALGLRMAGIKTVASFEWWGPAVETSRDNLGHDVEQVDIRKLDPASLPIGVDFVVGSPPCTQFSFSNRGGNGDIAEGLKDIHRFLEFVEAMQPRAWAMENVPRVAGLLEAALGRGGQLSRFADLVTEIEVVDAAGFGLPQRRKRMVAGRFPRALFDSYRGREPSRTLGDVVEALADDPIVDPVYGFAMPASHVSGRERERSLDPEEERMNREAKEYHPVYNVMRFPDPLDRTARTVTATCTRVSRESIVVPDGTGGVRRLTLRERASLQGFPITFEFYGSSYSDRLKMVGNAIPPLLTYYLGHAMLGTPAEKVPPAEEVTYRHERPSQEAAHAPVHVSTSRYPAGRRFRAAIPGLRFGSGVRFDLANGTGGCIDWGVHFFHGTSKRIERVTLDEALLGRAGEYATSQGWRVRLDEVTTSIDRLIARTDPVRLQAVWAHRAVGLHPFEVLDALGRAARVLEKDLIGAHLDSVATFVLKETHHPDGSEQRKLRRFAPAILAGLLVGSIFNSVAEKRGWTPAGAAGERSIRSDR